MTRDVVIIGGGVAGLTAAIYLGRFRRPALVIDGDSSRARWIPESHNLLGFPQGIGGEDLLARLRSQAGRYSARILPGWVRSVSRRESGFVVGLEGANIECRYVLLATGVEDHLPRVDGAAEALLRSVLRICPICDAFEAIDKRIAVVGDGEGGEGEARFLRTYSASVTYLYVGKEHDPQRQARLADMGIELIEIELAHLRVNGDELEFAPPRGTPRTFDVFYGALGCSPRIGLAAKLGARCDETNALRVSTHQETSVNGLYAAGDNVRGLNQVVIAAAEAAIAATDIHNRLRQAGH